MEKCYTVAETVKLTGVKSYVLRYWEDGLSLPIRRNELGHRCYTQDDIQLFLNIKELKNRGLQLRAIHDLLPKLTKKEGMEVIVPEEKDKIHLLESESIEKEENEYWRKQDEDCVQEPAGSGHGPVHAVRPDRL
mgnify:CR=1 FL=1